MCGSLRMQNTDPLKCLNQTTAKSYHSSLMPNYVYGKRLTWRSMDHGPLSIGDRILFVYAYEKIRFVFVYTSICTVEYVSYSSISATEISFPSEILIQNPSVDLKT